MKQHGVPFTINTDGPEMQRISLKKEYAKLLDNNILTPEEILKCNETATKASFIR
jgi:adenosine deaminase